MIVSRVSTHVARRDCFGAGGTCPRLVGSLPFGFAGELNRFELGRQVLLPANSDITRHQARHVECEDICRGARVRVGVQRAFTRESTRPLVRGPIT
jgi:hypothetical protein